MMKKLGKDVILLAKVMKSFVKLLSGGFPKKPDNEGIPPKHNKHKAKENVNKGFVLHNSIILFKKIHE
jgi:hypothetical protein